MKKQDTVGLNAHYLVRRIEVLGLKQWWVAREVGVDRKTVSRWVNGKVKRLARPSAARLAEVLSCELSELTVSDEVDVLATAEEQRQAAELIEKNDLLQLLSPTDNWQLAESVIKASMQPNLPLRQLGHLYNLLSIAAWRQGHYDVGRQRAERARGIGEQIGERAVTLKAKANLATIASFTASSAEALALYEECLEAPEYFDTKRDHAAVLSNLGDLYRAFLRFDESVAAQEQSIALFEELGLDFNLAISFVSLGVVRVEQGELSAGLEAYSRGAEHARAANYARGVDCDPIYRADVTALSGDPAAAVALLEPALPKLASHAVYDLGTHQDAARVYRLAGDLDAAAEQLAEGLRRSEPFPEIHGLMRTEEARLCLARGDAEAEARSREQANAAFRSAGLDVRVRNEPVVEHGTGAPL